MRWDGRQSTLATSKGSQGYTVVKKLTFSLYLEKDTYSLFT